MSTVAATAALDIDALEGRIESSAKPVDGRRRNVLVGGDALLDLTALVRVMQETAHEHPDIGWGYDAQGIHGFDPTEPDMSCPTCAALSRFTVTTEESA